MLKCLENLDKWLKSAGASLDRESSDPDDGGVIVYADAKPGYVWVANDEGCVTASAVYYGSSEWAKACRKVQEDCSMGMRKCTPVESEEVEWDRGLAPGEWSAPDDAPETIEMPAKR
jgi:hypothetical protein